MWRNRRWYVLLLILSIYLSIFYGAYSLMLIVFIIVLFPIITLICAFITKEKISAELHTDRPSIKKNEKFGMELIFKNSSIFPASRVSLDLTYWNQFSKNKKKEAYSISVEGSRALKVLCEIHTEYCGNLEFGISNMRLYDILGLWKFKLPINSTFNVTVIPDMPEIVDNMLRSSTEVFLEEEIYSTRRSGDDPSEVFRVREYAEGDKINRIHWKLSAKERTLMVKDFGLPLDSSVVILIELNFEGKDTERIIDAEIETAVSLSMQFILLKQIHFIAWFDIYKDDMVRVRIENEDHLYEALAQIFTATAYKDAFEGIVTYQEKYRTEQYSNLFYITTLLSKDEIYRIREFAKNSNCHAALVSVKDNITEEYKRSFDEAGLTYSVIHPDSLIDDISKMTLIPVD